MSNAVIVIAILFYDITLLAGTAYLVTTHNWSMWSFLLALCFFITTKSKVEDAAASPQATVNTN